MNESEAIARADALNDLGRYPQAEDALRTLLAQAPESTDALALLGLVLTEQERYAEAITVLGQAIAARPEEELSHRRLANALMANGEHASARRSAAECVRLEPHLWTSHYTHALSLVRGKKKELRSALSAIEQARRLEPNNAQIHNARGVILAELGRKADARAAYDEALRLDPQDAYAMNNLAAESLARGRLGAASLRLASGLATDPQLDALHRNFDALLGRLLRRVWLATLALGLVLGVLVAFEAPWPARAGLGVAMLVTYALLLSRFGRRLPPGSRLAARRFARREGGVVVLILIIQVVLSLAILGLAFLPQAGASRAGVLTLRSLQVCVLLWLFSGALQRGKRYRAKLRGWRTTTRDR